MPPKSVLVTYTLHPSPPPAQASYTVRSPLVTALDGIRAHFPLTNLHWKPTSRTSIRTIQSVDVDLVELGEVGTLGKEVAGSVLEWPLVNICFVSCDSDDMYKNQTKSFIRDWLSLLAARRNVHAPLIVLVNNANTAAAAGKNVFGRDKGVIAKLRTDFNNQKRDRCVQLNLPPDGKDDPATWVEVINKLKESIVSALDGAMLEREEDVKRGEAQRMTVGWNFCTWFLLKESLALSFEGVHLDEDALVVYEELEASFLQVLKEQNLSWFGKLGATGARDDSLPILDSTAKPYRELLQSSSISIFDFRIYVFARQAQLLGKIGRITEIAKRGQWFVASLTRRLRENEADLADNFIESWTYTACMDIVQKCDEWSRIDRPNGDYSGLIAYESARSELLDIARVQVERIGVAVGHLPNEYPFAPSSPPTLANDDVLFESSDTGSNDDREPQEKDQHQLSNQQLLAAIANKDNFRALYTTLTKRAMTAYDACGKANSVIRLKADLAALALLKEDWVAAYDLCRSLAKDCAELLIWEPASKFALEGALRAHTHLALDKQEDWTNLALAYLRICAILPDEHAELSDVLEGLESVPEGYTVEGHKAFSLTIKGDAAGWSSEADVNVLDVEIENRLGTPVTLRSLHLEFADVRGEEITFSKEGVTLQPGLSAITLRSTVSVQGLYTMRSSQICLGEVTFAYSCHSDDARIRIHRNPAGPKTVLRMPHNISLDRDPAAVLEVHAGSVALTDAKISLASTQDDVRYELSSATSNDTTVTFEADTLAIGDLPAGAKATVVIPYVGTSTADQSTARAVLSYTAHNDQERTAIDHQRVSMGLPLTVNVQDFFRPTSLVSHFTIASDGREYLRVKSVKLDDAGGAAYAVESARQAWDATTVISPTQPLSCLFRIDKRASDVSAVLRLVIEYRSIEDEIRSKCSKAFAEDRRSARTLNQALDERADWLQEYLALGRLGAGMRVALQRDMPEERAVTLIEALNDTSLIDDDGGWRTLEIPVDVPQRRLLTSVRFEHTSPQAGVYEGRAISLNMTFETTFSWLGDAERNALHDGTVEMMWDVAVSQDDWVVLGRKKGQYTAAVDKAITQEIVLVPVRAGKLFLPTVHANLLPTHAAALSTDQATHDAGEPGTAGHTQRTLATTAGESGIVCETYVVNAAKTVDVLPAAKTRTVLVPIAQRDGWEV